MVIGLINYRRSQLLLGAVDVDAMLTDESVIVASLIPAPSECGWACWIPDDPELSAAITALIDGASASMAVQGG